MFEINRLLLITTSEMSRTPAFDRAESLAKAAGAMLHIVAFDYVEALAVAGLFDHQSMAQAREGYLQVHRHWLEQQARFGQCKGLDVTTEVVWAKPSIEEVLEYVNDFRADIVIKDVQCVSAFKRVFYRPLDWLLLRDCPAPLHLVTDAKNPLPSKILAAIDLSHLEELTQGLNVQILDIASTLALSCGAKLHLLNVSGWTMAGDLGVNLQNLTMEESLRDAVNDAQEEAFDTLGERYGVTQVRRHRVTGTPHTMIERFAANNAFDMIVMGTVHYRGVNVFIGSTAENTLNRAPCSLMIVKPLS
ncbi:universal stress protein UspA [Pseudomonas brassicacearum]|uniref:Universal stress protein UspA n=1 Tax=Pseudomonas brassicacearum TaxID=930166 RepID=A0A423H9Q6_9PSED|nr:universal stress protein [Pseudomonas brassicacearum]RON09921.1 universal stress protein UspA [Pseudomonas brassicacearum]